MYIILKSTMNGKHDHFPSDTTAASPEPSPYDPWLFTDPFARDLYMHRNLIDQLEEDIRTYVLCAANAFPAFTSIATTRLRSCDKS